MNGFTEILLDRASTDDKNTKILEAIFSRGRDSLKIVTKLIGYSKDSEKIVTFDIFDLINSVYLQLKPELDIKNVAFEVKKNNFTEIDFTGYINEIKEVFVNLILNSVNAIKTVNGKIVINIKKNSKGLNIIIRDNGTGIINKDKEKIFNPFFSTDHNSTGLGLFEVKRIVEKHSGSIALKNTNEKGTTFEILLPLKTL